MKKEQKFAIQVALTCGVFWGALFFLMTLSHILTGYPGSTFLKFFDSIYIGYTVSWIGSMIGLVWAFVDGFIGAYIFVRLYELIGKKLN